LLDREELRVKKQFGKNVLWFFIDSPPPNPYSPSAFLFLNFHLL